jgi:hypothetical protein
MTSSRKRKKASSVRPSPEWSTNEAIFLPLALRRKSKRKQQGQTDTKVRVAQDYVKVPKGDINMVLFISADTSFEVF